MNENRSMSDYRTRRSKDEKDEKIVGEYLDTYFYPTFTTTITRNTDKDTQIKGVDLTATGYDGVEYTIDEKAATRWVGRNLQTFAHEISSVNVSGYTYNGWFVNPKQINDYYVYVWIDELNTQDNKLYKYDDISDATVVFVKKKDIHDYMNKNHVTARELIDIAAYLRDNRIYSTTHKGFKITMQVNQQEQAGNILIPRSILVNDLATYAVQITGKDADKQVTVLHK